MNPFNQLVQEILTDNPDFLEELTSLMRREHKPFLSKEQAFRANAHDLEHRLREEIDKWFEWLPDTPINRIGGSLAVEMLDSVDWDQLASFILHLVLA